MRCFAIILGGIFSLDVSILLTSQYRANRRQQNVTSTPFEDAITDVRSVFIKLIQAFDSAILWY